MNSSKLEAQKGDPKAIATCLKAVFPIQPVEVNTRCEQNLLVLELRTLSILDESQTLAFIEQWLGKLNPSGIELIAIKAQLHGQSDFVWEKSLTLGNSEAIADPEDSTQDNQDNLAIHYQQLDLEPDATMDAIHQAYFKLKIQAKRSGNTEKLQALKTSYQTLTTQLQQQDYEQHQQQEAIPSQESTTPDNPYANFNKEDIDLLSFKNRYSSAIIFPLLSLIAIALNLMPFSKFLLRGINIWFHEFGHATIAWLSGRRAIPLPFGWTNFEFNRSSFVYFGILFLLGLLFFAGKREKRPWAMVLAVAIAILQFWMTWLMSTDTFYVLFSFGGIGGEFYLCAFLMVNYFFALPKYLRWDFYRFPLVFAAAFTFWHQVGFWHQIDRGQATIPWGTLWGGTNDSGGDMNLLVQYGWSSQNIIDTYNHLGGLCIVAILATYFYFAIKQNRHALLNLLGQLKGRHK